MVGHQHERCVQPDVSRKRSRRRWAHTAWYCDCGKAYRLLSQPKYPNSQPYGEREWVWKEAVPPRFALADHEHRDTWATDTKLIDLEGRLIALETKLALETKKKRVQKRP